MGLNHTELMYTQHIDIVIGNKAYIERILDVRGFSPATIDDVMEKIESIIEHSGKLGRVIQREKDDRYIKEAKEEVNKMQRKMWRAGKPQRAKKSTI